MAKGGATLLCIRCGGTLLRPTIDEPTWRCPQCRFVAGGNRAYAELIKPDGDATANHYTLQWGGKLGFLEFIRNNPAAKATMPGSRMGWPALFREIRARAKEKPTWVYDAACGFGGIANELIDKDTTRYLVYVGADIHSALQVLIDRVTGFEQCGLAVRWDIGSPLPVKEQFDFVLCRAAIHHTPDPRVTFRSLCASLKPSGTIAISVYRRKAICREASDDALRAVISKMREAEAFEACRQFTVLGKALQALTQKVCIDEDLPILGVAKGEHSIQELIYYKFLKCFYNSDFGDLYSTLVNYDWYHPQFAYRYELDEVKQWFDENGIELMGYDALEVQYFLMGRKAGQGTRRD